MRARVSKMSECCPSVRADGGTPLKSRPLLPSFLPSSRVWRDLRTRERNQKAKMKQESQRTPQNPEKSQDPHDSIDIFAVQCGKCFKWRSIPTQEEYEVIRHNFIEDPWFCNKNNPDVSCDDPADIEYDNSRTWVIDKPNIPKSPEGFRRGVSLRRDYSKMDAFYIGPTGKKVRAPAEVEKFLEAYPKYRAAGIAVADFNFSSPKVMEDTIPRGAEATGSNKKLKKSKREDDDD